MAIIDSLYNQKGIQTYNMEINQFTSTPGRGDLLYHTNGKTYCVWAETSADFTTRNLYFSYSIDGGQNWQSPVQLTSSNWDDDPALIQLDLTTTLSDVGIAFTRSTTTQGSVYRFSSDQYGNITSPIDSITLSGLRYICLEHFSSSSTFLIAGLSVGGYPIIYQNLTGFFTNNWTICHTFTSSDMPHLPVSFRLRKLQNGDYAVVWAGNTTLNGTWSPTPNATSITDVYCMTSNTNCSTWSTPQNLTSYSGTPQFTLSGNKGALDADICQLSDGSLSIIFSEGFGSQFLSNLTSPSFAPNSGTVGDMIYHAPSNNLLIASSSAGFYTYNLSNGTVRRYYTGSAQALWSSNIKDIAVSTDGSHVAVSTDISLELFATNGQTDPINWTLTSLRTTTTPATHSNPTNILYQDTSNLFVGWANSGIGRVGISLIDCANISSGFTDLLSDASSPTQSCDSFRNALFYNSGVLHWSSGTRFYGYVIATAVSYSSDCGFVQQIDGCYDDVNNLWYIVNGVSGNLVTSITDTGGTITHTLLPSTAVGTGPLFSVAIPGSGMLIHHSASGAPDGMSYYSFVTQAGYGTFEGRLEYFYQKPFYDTAFITGLELRNIVYTNGWLLGTTGSSNIDIRAIHMDQVGRLRQGYGTYNATTQVISIPNFYDMVNQTKLGSLGNKVLFPRHTRLGDNTIVLYGNIYAYDYGSRPFAAITGVVAAAAELLSCQARIKQVPVKTLQIKASMSTRYYESIQAKARLTHLGCVKIKANILPHTARTIQCKATVLGSKSVSVQGTYLIAANQKTAVRAQFYVGTGYNNFGLMQVKATIARTLKKKVSVHFIIPATQGAGNYSFNAVPVTHGIMSTKARIS